MPLTPTTSVLALTLLLLGAHQPPASRPSDFPDRNALARAVETLRYLRTDSIFTGMDSTKRGMVHLRIEVVDPKYPDAELAGGRIVARVTNLDSIASSRYNLAPKGRSYLFVRTDSGLSRAAFLSLRRGRTQGWLQCNKQSPDGGETVRAFAASDSTMVCPCGAGCCFIGSFYLSTVAPPVPDSHPRSPVSKRP